MSGKRSASGDVGLVLSGDENELFRKLIGAIELREIVLQSVAYRRFDYTEVAGTESQIEFKTAQKVEKSDPVVFSELLVGFHPHYNFEILINGTKAMELQYHYGLVFQVVDKGIVDQAWATENVKRFFVERQLPRITWSFLREEIYTAMSKCGLRAIPLPLLRW